MFYVYNWMIPFSKLTDHLIHLCHIKLKWLLTCSQRPNDLSVLKWWFHAWGLIFSQLASSFFCIWFNIQIIESSWMLPLQRLHISQIRFGASSNSDKTLSCCLHTKGRVPISESVLSLISSECKTGAKCISSSNHHPHITVINYDRQVKVKKKSRSSTRYAEHNMQCMCVCNHSL